MESITQVQYKTCNKYVYKMIFLIIMYALKIIKLSLQIASECVFYMY